MADNVLSFKPTLVSREPEFDAGKMLDAAKAQNFIALTILGETADGVGYIISSDCPGDTLLMLERAKHHIVTGDE